MITLVLGASGVGKSRVAIPLAARLGVPLAEADDIVTALRAVHPLRATDHFGIAEELMPGFRAVIADHLEFDAPVVFEGDFLVPELVAEFGVRGVLIVEPDPGQLLENFTAREPDAGAQRERAADSVLIGAELARRAAIAGMPIVPARPWSTVLDRVIAALG